jgi:catechol 2,3-dioxygenase-like lactoylglutathione lyase family enzyme
MELRLEVIVVPVSDVDRAKAFYSEKLGFNVDVDRQVSDDYRVVQLTPPGSACSIVVQSHGGGLQAPSPIKGLQLVTHDLRATRAQLVERGADVGQVQVFADGAPRDARDDDDLDFAGFVFFDDPDGNGWAIQQMPRGRS